MNSKGRRIAVARRAIAAAHAVAPVERYHAKLARLQAAAKRDRAAAPDLWCILRTSSGQTLNLALSLVSAGFEAWTPCEVRPWRRAGGRKRDEQDVAMLPSFVFVRADRSVVDDLYRILSLPVSPHPAFTIFRHAGRVPLVTDGSIKGLRKGEGELADARQRKLDRERLAAMRKQRSDFTAGQQVRVVSGAFAGLSGPVVGTKGRDALVEIMGRACTIGAWLLVSDQVSGRSSPEDMAAEAA